ncbi:SdrD B-like domain-containing protein [Chelativorans sp. M5D2P16]|uniref:SdrD B-like domain-containing protein n=1 Tax=Chelativorans sp. M5D2P16 TaxID=3095678 RepID=UPI002AC9F439|nr:SdrD B-like domain-containing protein [Chelativorans sp. M5D2P16]MDZ5696851.1 hypothetical protein [Chelativorans sp. M5D2P16]
MTSAATPLVVLLLAFGTEEPALECGQITGIVFEDVNRNGVRDSGERGLAGTRILTGDGKTTTTDKHGRYHIACASVPHPHHVSDILVNLDLQTLPDGYRTTTENPRLVRLMGRYVSHADFGAAELRLVKIDLADADFLPRQLRLKAQSLAQVEEVMNLLREEPSRLEIIYRGRATELRRARLDRFADLIERRWRNDGGDYSLDIHRFVIAND